MAGLTPARLGPSEGRVHVPAPETPRCRGTTPTSCSAPQPQRHEVPPLGHTPGSRRVTPIGDPRSPRTARGAPSRCHPQLTYPGLQTQAPQARPRAGASCPAPLPGSRPRRPRPPRPWRRQGRSGAEGRPGAGGPRAHGDRSGTTERARGGDKGLARPPAPPAVPALQLLVVPARVKPRFFFPAWRVTLSPSRPPGLRFPSPPALFPALPYHPPPCISSACSRQR